MRILVVEDSAKMAGLLRKGLERDGHAVDVTGSGDEATWMAVENDYDAIVLDIILDASRPGIDGFEVCRRALQAGCWTPVLMVTARDAVSDRVRGLDTGADDYLPKPFSLQEFQARVRALIRRGSAPRPAVLRVGDLALDPATHEVWRGNVPVSLTSTEFALLEYFMRNVDRVLTRTQIGEHVWDMNFDTSSNVIDVYVSMLRRKIDKEFPTPLIHTIIGTGYMFSATRP